MAFAIADLGQVRYTNGHRIWDYTTTDSLATVNSAQYFNAAVGSLQVGDWIFIHASTDGTREDAIAVVASNDGTDVDVTDGVPLQGSQNANKIYLTGEILDVSTADQVYIACPVNGDITAVYSVIEGAITGADAGLTIKAPDGTVGTITIANSGSAAGTVDSLTSGLSNTEVDAGEAIEVETDGASTGTQKCVVTIEVTLKSDND